jgi:hypothetical protein
MALLLDFFFAHTKTANTVLAGVVTSVFILAVFYLSDILPPVENDLVRSPSCKSPEQSLTSLGRYNLRPNMGQNVLSEHTATKKA